MYVGVIDPQVQFQGLVSISSRDVVEIGVEQLIFTIDDFDIFLLTVI